MKLRKCISCNKYTMKEICSICKKETISPEPMKFSMEDRYGKYRRLLRRMNI